MEILTDLQLSELAQVIKVTQKERLVGPDGSWAEFLQAKHPKFKLVDPNKHDRQTIMQFLEGLLQKPENLSSSEAVSDDDNVDEGANKEDTCSQFLTRYLNWMAWKKEIKSSVTENQLAHSHVSPASSEEIEANKAVWKLVERTRNHPRYAELYNLPSYKKGWTWVRKRASGGASQLRLFALDCEMVETDVDSKSLVGLCLVDEEGTAMYKTLVKPKGKVLNYRTELTGLEEKDLEGVSLTLQKARKAIKKLLSKGAILVGHSLQNDLTALQLDHCDVIDTALLFTYQGLPQSTPSLKDLAKTLLGIDMRKGAEGHHDSFEDAAVTMKLLQHELGNKDSTGVLQPPDFKVPKEDLSKLLVHSIPAGVTEEDFRRVFSSSYASTSVTNADEQGRKKKDTGRSDGIAQGGKSQLVPSFESIEGDLSNKKVVLIFKHAGVANEAFKNLEGPQTFDSLGRATKTVSIGPKKNIKVRKMACHNGQAFGKDKQSPSAPSRKRVAPRSTTAKPSPKSSGPSGPVVGKAPKAEENSVRITDAERQAEEALTKAREAQTALQQIREAARLAETKLLEAQAAALDAQERALKSKKEEEPRDGLNQPVAGKRRRT
ncbi:hypothetical protein CEUSTIGMA_g3696.t1 [Chlamydomonas eustigma]|uniref:Exonuclease domain-containing protein n=1 Tax=Chlamydomonas eustigma TaxID=1157962 RepID=A0A250X037_9CHLO|nr:hypothetical protein CEUSTIGMA_g3696.t1 [Chlamydomonas eustigma]|eukprot:GAX76252.1 hypothetical protein CEUSTIGMA_g3696.t1 [Chlamydomonas eustigma]